MNSLKLILVGMLFGALALYGCQKITTPPQLSVNAGIALPNVVGPTTELEKMGAVKIATPAEAKNAEQQALAHARPVSKSSTVVTHTAKPQAGSPAKLHTIPSVEKAAYEKAQANAMRAECLRRVVEYKLNVDVEIGVMRELGSVVEALVCR